MGERDADRVVDLGGRREGRIEILPIELAHQLEADLARDLPVELAPGELAVRLAADMNGERRTRGVEELLGVIVGEDDPQIGVERAQPVADVGRNLAHMRHHRLVLGVRHGEELGRVRQHGAANHRRHHGCSPSCSGKNIAAARARQADGPAGFCFNARLETRGRGKRMVEVPITIACGNYDRTQAIKDGVVKVEGCAATYLPLYPEEIFFRAFRYQEFDVSELSFSSYIRTVAAGNSAYIGIPAFVSRLFRHSGIYVRS